MNPRLLVVEDEESQVRAIKTTLRVISESQKKAYGISDFSVDVARWAAKARAALKQAVSCSNPYDILLLDLELPEDERAGFKDTKKGLEILTIARETNAARSIIVVSRFRDFDNVAPAFRGGAVDFIAKGYTEGDFQGRLLTCWDQLLAKDSARLLDERIKTLVPHAERVLTHRFSACFSQFIQSIVSEAEGVKTEIRERFDLDTNRDSQDSLVRRLIAIEKSIKAAKSQWTDLQARLGNEDGGPGKVVVETVIEEITNAQFPCLIVKGAVVNRPQAGETRVLTFYDDVRAVLGEIILGGLSELADHCKARKEFEISVESDERYAKVRFKDNLEPLDETATTINQGYPVSLNRKFGRAWGLSVVQHAALRGGGRLIVKPKTGGNVITYLIPLAQNA